MPVLKSLCLMFFLTSLPVVLGGCLPALFFGAATTTATAVAEERGIGGALSDSSLKTQITMRWLSKAPPLVRLVEIVVREGRVLLSGTVDTPDQQIEAIRLTWEIAGVKEVIDKIQVGDGKGFMGYMQDSWISGRMKTALLADGDVHSINYTVKTVNGVLYVMGVALSSRELEKVLTHGRSISGVQKVVSYVRLKECLTSSDSGFEPGDVNVSRDISGESQAPESVKVEALS